MKLTMEGKMSNIFQREEMKITYEFDKDKALSHIDGHHGTKTRCYSFFQSDDIGKIYEIFGSDYTVKISPINIAKY